jgi:PhzF family phenazine biosynthesis protein
MNSYKLSLVDVFGAHPLAGNPLAVLAGAWQESTATMQAVTRWFNLSETAFLGPPQSPEADYAVRIFTLDREMPFAGHPTLGACHAWLRAGGSPKRPDVIIQECGIGLVPVREIDGQLAFRGPPLLRDGPVSSEKITELAQVLGIERADIVDAKWGDNGPGWVMLLLRSADHVKAVRPRATHPTLVDVGLIGAYPESAEIQFEIRAFFTDQHGFLREDPVTGSLNAAAGDWLFKLGLARQTYLAAQGTCTGRRGRIRVSRLADGHVWVAGATATMCSGDFTMGDCSI